MSLSVSSPDSQILSFFLLPDNQWKARSPCMSCSSLDDAVLMEESNNRILHHVSECPVVLSSCSSGHCADWHEQMMKAAGTLNRMTGFLLVYPTCAWLVELYSTWIWTNNFFNWGQRHCWHFFLFSWTTRAISKHLKIICTCDPHKKDHAIYRWRTASPLFFCDVGRVSSTDKNTPSIASECKIGSTCVGRHLCLELYRRCTLI